VTDAVLDGYQATGDDEAADVARVRELLAAGADPWLRSAPLHLTASALVLHPDSGEVLLRWHQRQRAWLQVGGHGDPGETDALAIALREAAEETGLADLTPWPDGALRHVVICDVVPGKGEPAHEHADLRYFLATATPEAIQPESPDAPLRWLSLDEARALLGSNNLRITLDRAEHVLATATDLLSPGLLSLAGKRQERYGQLDIGAACAPATLLGRWRGDQPGSALPVRLSL
jgi:8-oxo-dGTP pyrophosphatase MutT (NUDIX family)